MKRLSWMALTLIAVGLAAPFGHALDITPSSGYLLPIEPLLLPDDDLYTERRNKLLLNRNGELAAILNQAPAGDIDDYVLFCSPARGFKVFDPPGDARVFDWRFTNGGALIYDSQTRDVLALPWEGEPERLQRGLTAGLGLNDSGVAAIAIRPSTSTSFSHVWQSIPGQPPTQLPDLVATQGRGDIAVDPNGRLIRAFWSGEARALYRYDSDNGWQNLTDGKLPPGVDDEELSNNTRLNSDGDFLFESRDGGSGITVHHFDGVDDTITPILTIPGRSSDNLALEQAMVADNGRGLFYVSGHFSAPRGWYLNDPQFGTIHVDELLPDGEELWTDPYMNYRGDVAVVTWTRSPNAPSTRSGYLLRADSQELEPFAFRDLQVQGLDHFIITEDLRPFFWLQENGQWRIMTTRIPEPSSVYLAMGMVGVVAVGMRMRRSGTGGR